MDGSRSFGRAMTADAAWEREFVKELTEPIDILRLLGIDLRVRAFQIGRTEHTRCSMTRTSQEDHVEVVCLDQTIKMHVDERQPRTRSPMAEQSILDVLR